MLKYASLTEVVRFQLSGIWFRFADLLTTGRPFKVLAMFVLGLWVGRSGMLRDIEPWVPLLRRVRLVCLAVGLPAALVQALIDVGAGPQDLPLHILGPAAYALGVAPLAVAYASHLALLWRRAVWRDRLAWAIAPGRMALTNYLMQTFIAIALFYGIGLGLMGQAGPVTWPLIAGVVVAFQAAFSWWWLGRFPFGPMEWLWRRATYGRFSAD